MSSDFYFGLLCGLTAAMQVASFQGHEITAIIFGLLGILSGAKAVQRLHC